MPTPKLSARTGLIEAASLTVEDELNPNLPGSFKDDYELTDVVAGEAVLLFAIASFGVSLQLVDSSSGSVLQTISAGPLGFTPQSGVNYLIRVTSLLPAQTGNYTLRALPNIRIWDADSGDWAIATNWLNDVLPGANDRVQIERSGEITVTHRQGDTTIRQLESQEQISVQGGSLTITDGASVDAPFVIRGGTVRLQGESALRQLTLSAGTLTGEGRVVVTNGADWTSGTYGGKGLVIADESTLNISSNLAKVIGGGVLENRGLVTWSAGILISNVGESVITNAVGGIFNIAGDRLLDQPSGSPLAIFNNAGRLQKTAGTGTAVLEAVLNNTGTVGVQTGTLALFGGGTNSGTFQVDAGATLEFSNLVFTLAAGTSFTGPGTIRLDGGSLVANQPLSLSGGRFDGIGSFTGNLVNLGATINPGVENPLVSGLAGLGIGELRVSGNYFQGDNGTLKIQLGGTNPGSAEGSIRQFDRLNIGDIAEFDGTLNLDLVNGFVPVVGDRFTIATFGASRPNRFDQILQSELLALGLLADTEFNAQDLTLVIRTAPKLPSLSLDNPITNLPENTSTAQPTRLANLTITDLDGGQNNLVLSGADAGSFEIFSPPVGLGSPQLRLKAGVLLDFETKAQYNVTVNVDDPAISGNTPEASQAFTFSLNDLFESPPFVTNFGGDNSPDLVWRNGSAQGTTGEASIVLMDLLTLETQVSLQPFIRDRHWQIQATGDFDGDRKADLVWRNQATGQNVLWRMDGSLPLQPIELTPVTNRAWEIRGTGDFDRNGLSDLLWYNTQTRQAAVWYLDINPATGTGSETRATFVTQQTEPGWQLEGSGDFDGNGTADLAWSKGSEVSIWSMNGLERTRAQTLDLSLTAGYSLGAIGDYNQDRKSDFVWQNATTGQTEVWLKNGEVLGRFPLDRSSLAPGLNLVA